MRALILLTTVWCCSAQLVYHGYPWGPLATPLLATPKLADGEELKTVPLVSPYLHPFHTGFPLHTGLPLTYSVKLAEPTLKATEFPFIYTEKEESSRRKRDADISVPLPYLHAVPTVKEVNFETKQFEPIEAAVPASTTKIELTTKEHSVNVPAVKYVQPVVNYKPVTYTAQSVVPYAGLPLGYSGLHHAGLPLTYSGVHHAGLPLTYSGLHPFGVSPFTPLINIDEAAEETEEEVVESARRKRDLTTVKLPYLHAVPTTKTVTFETKGFEPIEAAVPASTTKIELTTKEHEVDVPAVKYVQPVVSYKPVTYTHQSVVPYAGLPLTYSGVHHAGLPLTYSGVHHAGLPLTYSGLHPFGLSPYAPLVKLDTAEAAEE